ncbi:hypothetical protein ZEAMMB73_Zm00001d028033 [Zea mays]|uniref:Uncharacterized protein n=1 Tax=Zea mays TaxID=4577 RepID=A0A1D6JRD3_MAIZE|nr:hypothetical protein ZEAMMB73_Zm00001d028033 [Zea mays]
MIIKTLKAPILRALKPSSLPAAGDGARSPTKPAHQCHDGDVLSNDASFFDAREPLDAWELVDDGARRRPATRYWGSPPSGGGRANIGTHDDNEGCDGFVSVSHIRLHVKHAPDLPDEQQDFGILIG